MLKGEPMNAILDGLAQEGIKLLVEGVLVGGLTLVAALLAHGLVRRGKVWIGTDAGRTCMSPFVLLLGLLLAIVAVVILAVGLYFRGALRVPADYYAWLGLVGGFFLGSLAILPFVRHTWEWDATGLKWRGAWRSVAMRWPDLVQLGKSMNGQLYVTDRAGRKITWSPQYTLEPEALLRAIQAARPDLALPP
jgi:hypothetical protein